MNCERFQTVVSDLAREQKRVVVMEAGDRDGALAHVAECESCAVKWEAEAGLSSGLRSLAEQMNSLAAPPRVEADLLAAFRQRSNVQPAVRFFPTPRQVKRYWVAAVAALLLIVFGIFVVRARILSRPAPDVAGGRTSKPTAPQGVQPQDKDQPAPVTAADKNPTNPNNEANDLPPHRNPNKLVAVSHPLKSGNVRIANAAANEAKTSAENSVRNNEIATDFYPLGYGNAPTFQEGGQLVRVELPRTAVARFGLPVNMDLSGERVKADVFVGVDGLAQAIRFVH